MAVRTTVDIPEHLHELLRDRADRMGTSLRALILAALEDVYAPAAKGERVTGPFVGGSGKLGPDFPVDENPHDIVFS